MHPAYFKTVFWHEGPEPEWPDEFVIISAHATTGEAWPQSRNEAADEKLRLHLGDRCSWLARVVGASPDGSHREPSWACNLGIEGATQVGQRFEQDAIYAVSGDVLSVIACAGGTSARAGSFRERLHGLRD